jgi:hypothetical protein
VSVLMGEEAPGDTVSHRINQYRRLLAGSLLNKNNKNNKKNLVSGIIKRERQFNGNGSKAL